MLCIVPIALVERKKRQAEERVVVDQLGKEKLEAAEAAKKSVPEQVYMKSIKNIMYVHSVIIACNLLGRSPYLVISTSTLSVCMSWTGSILASKR